MLAIKNNIMAANAARHLGTSYDALATSKDWLQAFASTVPRMTQRVWLSVS
jgi:hypothetical protein